MCNARSWSIANHKASIRSWPNSPLNVAAPEHYIRVGLEQMDTSRPGFGWLLVPCNTKELRQLESQVVV